MGRRRLAAAFFLVFALRGWARAQIDPEERELVEIGYDHPVSGAGPTAGYLFLYLNRARFLRRDASLRLALAPVYLDAEYGLAKLLGPRTDLGIGLAGGGFAHDYAEVRGGHYFREESFHGHGAAASVSVYHRFNPDQMIPLSAVVRQGVQYFDYGRAEKTAAAFALPSDHLAFVTRAGLRFGGQRPMLPPSDALEVSAWYEGRFRDRRGAYGYSGERALSRASHLFWLKTVAVRVQPGSGRRFGLGISAGSSIDADRLNAFGLGGFLPLTSDFPRDLPGYYNRELGARRFALFSGQLGVPLDRGKRFLVNALASWAFLSYVPGLEQEGHSHAGVGLGLQYDSASRAWSVIAAYGYGLDAIRSGRLGAHSVSLAVQFDLLARRSTSRPALADPLPAFRR